jgi:hypothetical protein
MYHFKVRRNSSDIQRFEECSKLYMYIRLYRVIILKGLSIYDMWLTKVHCISHCKKSNWYVVINNCVMIFQRYVFFGSSSQKLKKQDQCFCDMLLQNAFNLFISNKKKSILTTVYFRGILLKGLNGMYTFIR